MSPQNPLPREILLDRMIGVTVLILATTGMVWATGTHLRREPEPIQADTVTPDDDGTSMAPSSDETIAGPIGTPYVEGAPVSDDTPTEDSSELILKARFADDTHWLDKYIHFMSSDAELRVREFSIACPQPGKSIRLMDTLRRAASQGHGSKTQLFTYVESREGEVRILHELQKYDGEILAPQRVVMDIDRWDELHLHGIDIGAVMVQCYL